MQVAGGWVRIKLVQYNLHLKSLGMGSRKCRFLVNVMGEGEPGFAFNCLLEIVVETDSPVGFPLICSELWPLGLE